MTGRSRLFHSFVIASLLVTAGWSDIEKKNSAGTLDKGVHLTADHPKPPGDAGTTNAATTNGIFYHGGPLILGTTNIYYIWYGNWGGTSGAHAVSVLQNLASHIGGSPYFNINTTYTDGSNRAISNAVNFAGSTTDNYSQGTALTDNAVQAIVTSAITSKRLPLDTNGIYFVLTSADVNETSGFCTQYCGWHTNGTISGLDVKFAFIGNANRCLSACAAQSTSPNADPGVDGMASIISHELEEAVTDPDGNAWFDNSGNENADKCAWTFGTTFAAPNGSAANMVLGGLDYLIQQNWVNAGGGKCALSYSATAAPTLTSVNPGSGATGTSVPVTLTGTGFTSPATINAGTGITVSNVQVVSATQITAAFAIASNAPLGGHSVSVTTSAGTSGTATFSVAAGAPTLGSISPNSGSPGTSPTITLTGTNFVSPATINVSGTGITVSNVVVSSSTKITATFAIASSAALTTRTVSVSTSAGTSGTVNFTVKGAAPTLVSHNPTAENLGQTVNVTITGTNFVIGGTTVNLTTGTGLTVTNVSVASSTQLTATFTAASNASIGVHQFSVTTAAGTSNTRYFRVFGTPTLSSISPTAGTHGTSVAVTLSGSSLSSDSVIQVSGGGVTVTGVTTVQTGASITATFVIASTAATGPRSVTVTNSIGTSNAVTFTVN